MKSSFVFLFIMVFVFLSFAEQIDCQTNNQNEDSLKIFYGFHLSPEVNKVLKCRFGNFYENRYCKLGFNSGFDIDIKFKKNYGISSGISFLYLPFKYSVRYYGFIGSNSYTLKYYEGHRVMGGIPIKFLLNKDISSHVGVFMKTGIDFYIPIKSELKEDNMIIEDFNSSHNIYFIEEAILGITYGKTNNIIYSLGLSERYSFFKYIVYNLSNTFFTGIQVGLKFKF